MRAVGGLEHIQKECLNKVGTPVVFTKKAGSKRIVFKGILTQAFNRHALILLDENEHNFETYSFSYVHLLLEEGTLKAWDKLKGEK